MNILADIIDLVARLVLSVFFVRFWAQWARVDFYNPLAQFVYRFTHPVCQPLRRLLPNHRKFDWASLLVSFCIALIAQIIIVAIYPLTPSIDVILKLALVVFLQSIFNLLFWIVLVQAIASFIVPPTQNPALAFLHQLTAPMLRPIQRVLPSAGGLDFSPMVLMFIAYLGMRLITAWLM